MSTKKCLVKAIVLGGSTVGKSKLIFRWVHDQYMEPYKATIGADFAVKEVAVSDSTQVTSVTVQLWDTAGQERFQGLGQMFMRGSDVIIYCVAADRPESLQELKTFIENGSQAAPGAPQIFVITKSDEGDQIVTESVLKEKLQEWNGVADDPVIFRVSAKTGDNVDAAFTAAAAAGLKAQKDRAPSSAAVARAGSDDSDSDSIDISIHMERKSRPVKEKKEKKERRGFFGLKK